MGHVDLDAARTARAEKRGDVSITFGGREYKLRPELIVEAGEAWRTNDARGFVERVLADKTELDDFMANEPSWSDLSGIFDAYDTSSGEQPASQRSSKNTSKRSRPTSSGSTSAT